MDTDTDRDGDMDMDMNRDMNRDMDRDEDRDKDSKEYLAVQNYIISSYSNAKNCGSEALKLRTSEKIALAEFRSWGCGANFFKKLRNCDCRSASFKLRVAIADF
jgi:hypothetical protein